MFFIFHFYVKIVTNEFQEIRGHNTLSDEVILKELSLPGLAELKGRWHGSLDASGGGNGDTMVDILTLNTL